MTIWAYISRIVKAALPNKYLPDFIVHLDTDLRLLVEIKGLLGEDAQIKQAAALRWVAAVNRCRQYGRWSYRMVSHPADLTAVLDGLSTKRMERALEGLERG